MFRIFLVLIILNGCLSGSSKEKTFQTQENIFGITLNGSKTLSLNSPQESLLKLQFISRSGNQAQLVNDFIPVYESSSKLNYLFIFHEDLSDFTTAFPELESSNNTFSVKLNDSSITGFDNEKSKTAFKKRGTYYLISKTRSQSKGLLVKKFKITIGESAPTTSSVTPVDTNATHISYFDANGNTLSFGAPYMLIFDYSEEPTLDSNIYSFHAKVYQYEETQDDYVEIADNIPWLSSKAELSVVSLIPEDLDQKYFSHLKSEYSDHNLADFTFTMSTMNDDFSGLNKFWLQFTHCQEGYTPKLIQVNTLMESMCKTPQEGDDENNSENPRVHVSAPVLVNIQ